VDSVTDSVGFTTVLTAQTHLVLLNAGGVFYTQDFYGNYFDYTVGSTVEAASFIQPNPANGPLECLIDPITNAFTIPNSVEDTFLQCATVTCTDNNDPTTCTTPVWTSPDTILAISDGTQTLSLPYVCRTVTLTAILLCTPPAP
jgi:hypothetical protein